jgi:predicted nucleic acid-binding Zn ribbon protein
LSKWENEPKRMSESLGAVGRKLGIGGAIEAGRIWSRWGDIVGPGIAEHAEPTSLRQGTLRIRTDSPVWATEIGYIGSEIARRANEIAGSEVVLEVRVWTGPGEIQRRSRNVRDPRSSEASEAASTRPSSDEPIEALGRARAAWERARSGGFGKGPRDPGENP